MLRGFFTAAITAMAGTLLLGYAEMLLPGHERLCRRDREEGRSAHRLSSVMHSDRIYVLERGRVVEEGRHEELVAAKGLYFAMWRQQVGERRLEPAPA